MPLSPTSSPMHKSKLWSVIENKSSCVATFSGVPSTWGSLLRTIDTKPRQPSCIANSIQGIIAACEDIVNIYDAVTFVLRQSLCAPEPVTKIQDSPDGGILFFAHYFSVTMWDVQTGGLLHTFTTKSKVTDMAVSKTHIACGLSNGFVTFWDICTKEESQGLRGGQPVVTTYWLSPQQLVVATWDYIYTHDIIVGKTSDGLLIPGHVWGMVYSRDIHALLVGCSLSGSGQTESFFMTVSWNESQELKLCSDSRKSPTKSCQLLHPTLVGTNIVCITPASGVQVFDIKLNNWTYNPPPLDAAKSVAVSLNRNLVVQTKDSIQIFSVDVLRSREARNEVHPSHIYPLGEEHIMCILQPSRDLTLFELKTMRELCLTDSTSPLGPLLENHSVSSLATTLVVELGVSRVQAWQYIVNTEDTPLRRWSPRCTRIVTFHESPRLKLRVKDMGSGTVLAELPLKRDDFGTGKVYDLTFDSETRFHLNVDGTGGHIRIPHEIIKWPSEGYSHTITVGEPVPMQGPRTTPYSLDADCEWVLDAKSRKICWISPGNVRRGDGGHFWAGLTLVMVGSDGVVRKLSFKKSDC